MKKVLVVLVGLCASAGVCVQTQAQTQETNPLTAIQVGTSSHTDVSPTLREIARTWPTAQERHQRATKFNPAIFDHPVDAPDSVMQNDLGRLATPSIPSPILSFDGIPVGGAGPWPPDTSGAAGLTQYVQTVNNGYEVFDKATGTSVLGPLVIQSLWSGFSGPCQGGHSDVPNWPVVLYDRLADRWVITRIVSDGANPDSTNVECVAVSTTSDATGSYRRYNFVLGTNIYVYPKFGIWPDAYYLLTEVYSQNQVFLGFQPFALDREKMLNGQTPTYITPGILSISAARYRILPVDLDGSTLPPSGAPATFLGFPGNGQYNVYHFHVDFVAPNNSTWTTFATPAAASFAPLCPQNDSCVPPKDTTLRLSGLGNFLMPRLAYRKFTDHESVVGNLSVNANNVAGIRWFELRDVTNGPVTVFQESTYQPDTTWRWTGSAGMDRMGNMALGFRASSAIIYPSIRYTGRLATDHQTPWLKEKPL